MHGNMQILNYDLRRKSQNFMKNKEHASQPIIVLSVFMFNRKAKYLGYKNSSWIMNKAMLYDKELAETRNP